MKKLTFEGFMKEYNLRNDTINESDIQKVHDYKIFPLRFENLF